MLFRSGLTTSKTQNIARNISNEIGSTLQFANGEKTAETSFGTGGKQFCIGNTKYTYYANLKYDEKSGNKTSSGLVSEELDSTQNCGSPVIPANQKQMLANNMRILKLDIDTIAGSDRKLWKVNLRLAYGDNDLLDNYNSDGTENAAKTPVANCRSGISGSSFCAVAQLDTTVKKRLN